MKKIYLTLLMLVTATVCCMAEEALHVSGFQAVPDDTTAADSAVRDGNGDPCALLRVYIDDATARFNGDIIGTPTFKNDHFEIWLLDAAQRIEVISQKAVPMWVEFADHGIDEVEAKRVYALTLAAPPINYEDIKNPGAINVDFFPYGAVVFVDKQKAGISPCTISGLEKGKHKISVWAPGFDLYEDDVKIKDWTPVDLKGSLFKKYTATGTFTYLENKYKKETKTVTKNGKTVTKEVPVISGKETVHRQENIMLQFAFVDPALFGKDEAPYGILEDKVTNRLWRIIMGSDSELAAQSDSEIFDPFYHDAKVKVPANEAQKFCDKLGELYNRKFRLATYNELRWARQMKNVKGLNDKEDSEWSMEESTVSDSKRRFRIILADVTEADIDLGDSSASDTVTYKDVKTDAKKGKDTGKFWRIAGGLLKDELNQIQAK